MTDLDERLLTAAKLHEQAAGSLDSDVDLHAHAGLVDDDRDRRALSFVESTGLDLGSLGDVLRANVHTREATDAVTGDDPNRLSAYVGVTEQELDASNLRLPVRLLDELENNGAPAFVTGVGNPNTGKTDLLTTLARLWKIRADDDALVIANFDSSITDLRVTSAHDLAVCLLDHRDAPKFVLLDEGSTHFDARTFSREVSQQWTPLAKRFAKIGVEVCGIIGHSGKDLHPETKRLTTLAYYKLDKKEVDFYRNWDADAEMPDDRLFAGTLDSLQKSDVDFSPDDAAPWSWDLRPDLFSRDLDWPALLDELRDLGPAET